MHAVDARGIHSFSEVSLDGASIKLASHPGNKTQFEGVYSSPKNLLVMYSGCDSDVEGRYLSRDRPEFSSVGQVVFRPANFAVQARGMVRDRRMEICFSDDRLKAAGAGSFEWDADRLQQTLNVRANDMRSLMHRLFLEILRPGFAANSVVDALLLVILHDLGRTLGKTTTKQNDWDYSNGKALKKVTERIADLSEVTPTVSELASLAALSERHLLRIFKREKGVSLCAYIREMRLDKAKHYLSWTELPLKEIAYRLGFSSHANFTTAFVRETGVTPTSFRRSHKRSLSFVGN